MKEIQSNSEVHEKFTNQIRIQALDDANFKLQYFLESTNLSQIKWFYSMAMKNNEKRKKLYI